MYLRSTSTLSGLARARHTATAIAAFGFICSLAFGQVSNANASSGAAANPVATKPGGPDLTAAVDWNVIQTAVTNLTSAAQNGRSAAAWSALAASAQKFVNAHPTDANVRSAQKLVAKGLIHADDDAADVSANARTVANAFIADFKNAVHDRVDVMITLEQAKLRRAVFASRDDWLAAHTAHARELIRIFPDQPEGYGYLLSLAQTESLTNTHQLADELSGLPAPAAYLSGAKRVIDRLALVGNPFTLPGAEKAIGAARGKVLVVYAWRASDTGFLDLVGHLAETPMTQFIGVNLDSNPGAARGVANSKKLPGEQFYDGGGIDGPMAKALHLFCTEALYFVDRSGVVRDVNAQVNAQYKLSQIVLGREE